MDFDFVFLIENGAQWTGDSKRNSPRCKLARSLLDTRVGYIPAAVACALMGPKWSRQSRTMVFMSGKCTDSPSERPLGGRGEASSEQKHSNSRTEDSRLSVKRTHTCPRSRWRTRRTLPWPVGWSARRWSRKSGCRIRAAGRCRPLRVSCSAKKNQISNGDKRQLTGRFKCVNRSRDATLGFWGTNLCVNSSIPRELVMYSSVCSTPGGRPWGCALFDPKTQQNKKLNGGQRQIHG